MLPLKHLISLGQMVHCRGQGGPKSPCISALGQNTVQSCISFLQSANMYFTTTKWMYDWNYLRLASIMSFFTATSHTCYCIFHSPKFHQLEEVKIQALHSDFTVLWTGKLFCRTWKPWWNCMVDFFFSLSKLFLIRLVVKPIGLKGFLFKWTNAFYWKWQIIPQSNGTWCLIRIPNIFS